MTRCRTGTAKNTAPRYGPGFALHHEDVLHRAWDKGQCNLGVRKNFARSDELTRTSKVTPSR